MSTTPVWTRIAHDTWELPGVGWVIRMVLHAEGDVTRYLSYVQRPVGAHNNQCINDGSANLGDAMTAVEEYASRRAANAQV